MVSCVLRFFNYPEQQSVRQESQLHKIQMTTENIHVSDGLRRVVAFLIIAPYKYYYLLTYLLTYGLFIAGPPMARYAMLPSSVRRALRCPSGGHISKTKQYRLSRPRLLRGDLVW